MKVPFMNLVQAHKNDSVAVEEAVSRVLRSGYWVGGSEVETFEKGWASYCGAANAVGVGNGTDAITLALWAAGVGEGDEVILPALSAYPSTVGVVRSGATPIFVDVKKEDGLINPSLIAEALTEKTKVIVPVHLYGNACDMPVLAQLAKENGLALVEDCAQAAAVSLDGKNVGLWSTAAAWSFYPTKNLGAVGDAGAVTSDDPQIAKHLTRLRNYGQSDRYTHDEKGINTRLDPLQAAVLSAKLLSLDGRTTRRQEIGNIYDQAIKGNKDLRPAQAAQACVPNRHLYPVFCVDGKERERQRGRFEKMDIATLIHYPIAMPDQKASRDESRKWDVPIARELAVTEFSVPLFPEMTEEQVQLVAACLAAKD